MQRRIIIMIGLLQFLSGCAVQAGLFESGVNASYSARNTAPREIEQVRLVDASNPDRWYFSQSWQPADTRKPGVKHVPGFGGNTLNPRKIPEEVLITWREMPPPGGQPYTGEPNSSNRVKVRERIPKEILAAARKDGFLVALSFTAGVLPILFNWKLVEFKSVSGSGRGIKDWCLGGDSFQDSSQKEIKPGNTYDDPIPIWPHCKLP